MTRTLRILTALLLCVSIKGWAQELDHTQYYLNLPGINPAFTGIEEYLDTRFSFRQGWNDFAVKNNYTYVSAYGALNNFSRASLTNNTLRLSDMEGFQQMQADNKLLRKHGVGGMLTSRNFGPYEATTINANYAYHVPISRNVMIAFGTKLGYIGQRISFNNFTVRDEVRDTFYQQVMATNQGNSGKFFMDFGYALYTPKFYLALSSENLVSSKLSGGLLDMPLTPRYSAQISLISIRMGNDFSFNPGARVIYSKGYDLIVSINGRLRYKDVLYIGTNYTNASPKLSFLAGFKVDSRISVNYAYDKYLSDLNNFNVHVHEIMIGMVMFNKYSVRSKLW